MAGEDLLASLYASDYAPIETGWGLAAQGMAGALPNLVNPYGSMGSNIAVTLGGALVAGLLGYQARAAADERNAAQALYLPELFSPTLTAERRAAIFAEEPRLAKVYKGLQLQRALSDITAGQSRATEVMKAEVEAQKQRAIDLGIPFKEAGESTTPTQVITSETGGYTYLGKKGEDALTEVQKTFANSEASKNYLYSKGVLERLAQGVMNTDAVSDADFAKGGIQVIEPGLATNQGEAEMMMKGRSVPEHLRALVVSAAEGKAQLTPKMRAQILGIAERSYKVKAEAYQSALDFYSKEAVTKTRRPELSDEIGARISAGSNAQPYEDVVQKWFKVPGVDDLGEYSAADIVKQIASGELQPDVLIRGLSAPQTTPQGKGAAIIGPSSVIVAEPTAGARMAQAMTAPTAIPVAVAGAAPEAQPQAVVVKQAPVVVKAEPVPVAGAVSKAAAAEALKVLMAKGKENWTLADRARYAELFSLFGGR